MAFEKTVISASVGGSPNSPGMHDNVASMFAPVPVAPGAGPLVDPWHPPMLAPEDLFSGAENRPEDVSKIQKLLNLVYRPAAPMPVNGLVDAALVTAIVNVQAMFGMTPDGIVGPTGATLRYLNGVAEPVKITKCQRAKIRHGSYAIAYGRKLEKSRYPVGYELLLCVGEPAPGVTPGKRFPPIEYDYGLDVRARPSTDLLSTDNHKLFLDAIGKVQKWGKKCSCRLYLVREGYLIWQSVPAEFDAPVRPYKGALSPVAIGTDRELPKMIYAGTGAAPFVGRFFQKIGDKHYFTYGGNLETDNAFRGFDCITYVGSSYGVSAVGGNMTSSANLATAMGAQPVAWTQPVAAPVPGQPAPTPLAITNGIGKGDAIKAYFTDPARTGTFLIWTGGHIRVIVNKTVHEWSPPNDKNGYEAGPVTTQVKNGTSYHLYSF